MAKKNDWSARPVICDQNTALVSPKKDECDKCVAYKTGNSSLDVYEEKQVKKY